MRYFLLVRALLLLLLMTLFELLVLFSIFLTLPLARSLVLLTILVDGLAEPKLGINPPSPVITFVVQ